MGLPEPVTRIRGPHETEHCSGQRAYPLALSARPSPDRDVVTIIPTECSPYCPTAADTSWASQVLATDAQCLPERDRHSTGRAREVRPFNLGGNSIFFRRSGFGVPGQLLYLARQVWPLRPSQLKVLATRGKARQCIN